MQSSLFVVIVYWAFNFYVVISLVLDKAEFHWCVVFVVSLLVSVCSILSDTVSLLYVLISVVYATLVVVDSVLFEMLVIESSVSSSSITW